MSETGAAAALDVEELADAIGTPRPALDPEAERLALALYGPLAEGEPVSVSALAHGRGRSPGLFHFFSSADVATPALRRHPDTFLVSVDQAFELGQRANRINFPTALA